MQCRNGENEERLIIRLALMLLFLLQCSTSVPSVKKFIVSVLIGAVTLFYLLLPLSFVFDMGTTCPLFSLSLGFLPSLG